MFFLQSDQFGTNVEMEQSRPINKFPIQCLLDVHYSCARDSNGTGPKQEKRAYDLERFSCLLNSAAINLARLKFTISVTNSVHDTNYHKWCSCTVIKVHVNIANLVR